MWFRLYYLYFFTFFDGSNNETFPADLRVPIFVNLGYYSQFFSIAEIGSQEL